MKRFLEDAMMGMLFTITLVMIMCALVVGALAAAEVITGKISLAEGALPLLICSGAGGCAIATAQRIDFM